MKPSGAENWKALQERKYRRKNGRETQRGRRGKKISWEIRLGKEDKRGTNSIAPNRFRSSQ